MLLRLKSARPLDLRVRKTSQWSHHCAYYSSNDSRADSSLDEVGNGSSELSDRQTADSSKGHGSNQGADPTESNALKETPKTKAVGLTKPPIFRKVAHSREPGVNRDSSGRSTQQVPDYMKVDSLRRLLNTVEGRPSIKFVRQAAKDPPVSQPIRKVLSPRGPLSATPTQPDVSIGLSRSLKWRINPSSAERLHPALLNYIAASSLAASGIPLTDRTAKLFENRLMSESHDVTIRGFLGYRSDLSKSLSFARLYRDDYSSSVQLVIAASPEANIRDCPLQQLRSIDTHSPVVLRGLIQRKLQRKPRSKASKTSGNELALEENDTASNNRSLEDSTTSTEAHDAHKSLKDSNPTLDDFEISVHEIRPFNTFPKDIDMSHDHALHPKQRHLQLRKNNAIHEALKFRQAFLNSCRWLLTSLGFMEIDTPLLFKSTSEGAREFIVPTRRKGLAYSLPQSPQQYKQILMASGMTKYFQVAKCFRDEDPRADRQAEFSQLDMELTATQPAALRAQILNMVVRAVGSAYPQGLDLPKITTSEMTYHSAMTSYGSDKPDCRSKYKIKNIQSLTNLPPLPTFISRISPLKEATIDYIKVKHAEVKAVRKTLIDLIESPAGEQYRSNPYGAPCIVTIDNRKPYRGFEVFGDDAGAAFSSSIGTGSTESDLFIFQARRPNPRGRWSGGSTVLGNFRLAMLAALEDKGLLPKRNGLAFCWILRFPMFKKAEIADGDAETGSGLVSNHHPFTSPASAADTELLMTDPLAAEAEHYDLVLNGVEVGGGSRRIHTAEMQEYVLKDVLKFPPEKIQQFSHLLDALRCGCPPHLGFALGLERFCAAVLGRESVRDVMAFPKFGANEDLLVKSPGQLTEEQLKTYHLRLADD